MDTDKDFEALVRKSGTVFVTNVGNGPEEMVLAIATPTLKKTQVATQADLVAAGYVRVEGLKRVEGEREHLKEALAETEKHFAAHVEESAARHKELLEQNRALEARVHQLEAAKTAEQEGIVARNENRVATENPYPAADEARAGARTAWAHGWKLRDMLLTLNAKVREQAEELRVLAETRRHLDGQLKTLQTDRAALQAHLQAMQAEKQGLLLQVQQVTAGNEERERTLAALTARAASHDEATRVVRGEVTRLEAEHTALLERYTLQSGRLQKIQAAYQRLLLEAPHSANCARLSGSPGAGCDCWLLKYGYAALEQR